MPERFKMKYAFALPLLLSTAVLAGPVTKEFSFPASVVVDTEATATECSNSGTKITFESLSVASGSSQIRLILKQNKQGTRVAEVVGTATFDLSITPSDPPSLDDTQFIKQGNDQSGVGGNPYIYFDIGDPAPELIDVLRNKANELGRCVQGTSFARTDTVPVTGKSKATVKSKSCGSADTELELLGGSTIPGLKGTLVLTNNPRNSQRDAVREATYSGSIAASLDFTSARNFAQKWNVGGNPLVYVRPAGANPNGSEDILLGRCKDLL